MPDDEKVQKHSCKGLAPVQAADAEGGRSSGFKRAARRQVALSGFSLLRTSGSEPGTLPGRLKLGTVIFSDTNSIKKKKKKKEA